MTKRFMGRDSSKSNSNKHRKSVYDVVLPVISQSDIILEILDSRYIEETRNPELEEKIREKGKKIIYILNKVDLVSLQELHKKIELNNIKPYVLFSCPQRRGLTNLRNRIKIEAKRILKDKRVDLSSSRYAHLAYVGVIGYPNTGKSSVINLLMGKGVAPTSPIAGFTKGMQKLKLTEDIMLLDTPGIIPKDENSSISSKDLKKHGLIGVETWQKVRNPDFVVSSLMQKYPGLIQKYYRINTEDADDLIQQLGRKKFLLKKGNLVDADRTARLIIRDWQDGKIRLE